MVEKLIFDSNCFNLNIGKIEINSDDEFSKLNPLLNDYDLVYVFSRKLIPSIAKHLIDKKVILTLNINDSNDSFLTFEPEIKSSDEVDFDYDQILNLAYASGEFSRFKLDKNLDNKYFRKLYKIWIDDSLNKKIANDVLIFSEFKKNLGLMTYKISDSKSIIGLISVDENSQGKGIGKRLIKNLCKITNKLNLNKIEVATQLDNIQALNFYKKCGFEITSITYIYHLWPKK